MDPWGLPWGSHSGGFQAGKLVAQMEPLTHSYSSEAPAACQVLFQAVRIQC